MSFTGFTESQISRDGKPAENQSQQTSNKKVTKTKQVARQQYRKTVSTEEKHFDIPNEARLSLQADTKTGNPDLLKNLDKTVNSVGPLEYKETTAENSEEKSQQEVDKSNEILNEKENVDTLRVETTSPSNHVESVLEKQKEIEAENRKKKEAIKKALDDRKSKTAQESQKLHNVQNELQKIDQIVAGDVRLLRKTIEEASYAYMEAQKRYEKAEKEFITAKESLFLKSERKDQLTAHLANIIQLNEERKAKKLTELMEELNIPKKLAEDAADALYQVHHTYLDPINSADLYPAAGASDDWYKGGLGVRYAFTTELRDTGNYGFELPANQIIPSGEEYVAGMRVIFEKIISDNADISQI